jgi:Uncharacterised protein family (UPF0014)
MMTGAVLGGADLHQAARLQMIIMFMTLASNALACVTVALFTLYVCVDSEHRIRRDCIYTRPHAFRRASGDAVWVLIQAHWLHAARVDYPYGHREAIVTEGSGS